MCTFACDIVRRCILFATFPLSRLRIHVVRKGSIAFLVQCFLPIMNQLFEAAIDRPFSCCTI